MSIQRRPSIRFQPLSWRRSLCLLVGVLLAVPVAGCVLHPASPQSPVPAPPLAVPELGSDRPSEPADRPTVSVSSLSAGDLVDIPFVFPRTWRGLRVGSSLGGCPLYQPDQYLSEGFWPPPRLTDPDGVHQDVLACTSFERPQDLSLGWVVPPEEAHYSGLCWAPESVRRGFAADPDNWVYGPQRVFSDARGSQGPGGWLPTRNRCWFARAQLRIRMRYGLSLTDADAVALQRVLAGCEPEEGYAPTC